MGISASIADQQRLFEELKSQYASLHATADKSDDEEPSDELREAIELGDCQQQLDEPDETHKLQDYETHSLKLSDHDKILYNQVNNSYKAWYKSVQLKQDVTFCELTDFEDALADAFKLNKTPLILDASPDDKVCTFFSYQPDVAILDAKSMVMTSASGTSQRSKTAAGMSIELRLNAMDVARKTLVNAMKFGKLLVIRLGTSAPDFVHTFCDESLNIDTSKASSAYFPLLVFEQGGVLLHDVVVDFAESRKLSSNGPFTPTADSTLLSREEVVKLDVSKTSIKAHTANHSKENRLLSWAERLFREEDMRPHKNFALCRDGFRVCVTSQLPLEHVEEFLFGGGDPSGDSSVPHSAGAGQGNLPSRDWFKIVSIVPDVGTTAGEKDEGAS